MSRQEGATAEKAVPFSKPRLSIVNLRRGGRVAHGVSASVTGTMLDFWIYQHTPTHAWSCRQPMSLVRTTLQQIESMGTVESRSRHRQHRSPLGRRTHDLPRRYSGKLRSIGGPAHGSFRAKESQAPPRNS
jgi:hypothetical protein